MITIKGVIGDTYKLVDFLAALVGEKDKQIIQVDIDSPGGYCDEGIAIYNTLMEKRSEGKTIVTKAVNECSSVASIIFMAGDTRIASCPLMIHNPWGGVEGDSRQVAEYAKELQAVEKQLEKIYNDRTRGLVTPEMMSMLMDSETYLSPQQAVQLGFATQATSSVVAMYNRENNISINKKTNKMANSKMSILERAKALIGLGNKTDEKPKTPKASSKIFAMSLQTVSGGVLEVDREEGNPEVGDAARPDGVHELPEGVIITVLDGVITDIQDVEMLEERVPSGETIVEESTVEQLSEIVTELVAEVEKLEAEAAQAKQKEKTVEEMRILNAVALAGGFDRVFKAKDAPFSKHVIAKRTEAQSKTQTQGSELLNKKLQEARKKAAVKREGK